MGDDTLGRILERSRQLRTSCGLTDESLFVPAAMEDRMLFST